MPPDGDGELLFRRWKTSSSRGCDARNTPSERHPQDSGDSDEVLSAHPDHGSGDRFALSGRVIRKALCQLWLLPTEEGVSAGAGCEKGPGNYVHCRSRRNLPARQESYAENRCGRSLCTELPTLRDGPVTELRSNCLQKEAEKDHNDNRKAVRQMCSGDRLLPMWLRLQRRILHSVIQTVCQRFPLGACNGNLDPLFLFS